MNTELDAWRRILLDRRAALLRARTTLARDEQQLLAQDASEPAERSAEVTLAGVLDALDDRDLAELQEIADALLRLETGRFGRCADCAQDLAPRRLKAYPAATLCTRCASERERHRHAV